MGDGFFNLPESEEPEKKKSKTPYRWTCKTCKLFDKAKEPKLEPVGNFKKEIMIIGSGYGQATNTLYGRINPVLPPKDYFKTDIGKWLAWKFQENGIDIHDDCVYINATACDTEKKVSVTHLGCCRQEKILPAIKRYKPKAIFLLGINALTSLVADRWGAGLGGFNRWRGTKIPDHEMNAYLFPIDDPADVKNDSQAFRLLWQNDLKSALAMPIDNFPSNPLDEIEIFYEDGDVGKKVRDFCKGRNLMSFDYETTGIRPYRDGHQIVCASVAVSPKLVMAFPFPYDVNDSSLDGFVELLRDKNIGKMAHNMCYEELWTRWCLGTQVINWKFDTMLASHVIDSRHMFTALKFQSYINFGVLGYESIVTDHLKSDSTDGTNDLLEYVKSEENMKELMKYCAIDSALQYKLAQVQAPIIGMEL